MLWGIDELLTYHYCISEFFMVAPAEITYEGFFKSSKSEQADLVWEHLFVKRCGCGLRFLIDKALP
jgi:hypothetical protein